MNEPGIKIEVHLIQNFAPSNLNRDDTGQPKSATFGGFRRARISSQSQKRAARIWWKEHGTVSVGDRTKRLQQLLFNALKKEKSPILEDQDDSFLKEGIRVFTDAYYASADKKKPERTSVLIFISPEELKACAQAILDLWKDRTETVQKKNKEAAEKTVEGIASIIMKCHRAYEKDGKRTDKPEIAQVDNEEGNAEDDVGGKEDDKGLKLKPVDEIVNRINDARVSADIALFGRMLAEQPGRNTDGSCQVAHPISTHKVDMEMDFFTAVDDLNPAEETGAGMMGVVGFNSACYYRYALVDRDQLARNLTRKTERDKEKRTWKDTPENKLTNQDYEEADKVIKAFLEAFVYAIPTGKQNSFAAQNLPSFGMFVRRKGGVPISLANAFAKPVRPTRDDDDLVGLSVNALTNHWDALKQVYGNQGVQTASCFHLKQDGRLNGLNAFDKGSVEEAIKAIVETTRQR